MCSKPSFLLRNPIEKVSAFLDTKHKDRFCKSQQPKISPLPTFPTLRYKMFNLCSEKTYDTSFFHGRVERVLIDDHNVPSLQQMLEFANKVPDDGTENIIYLCVCCSKTVCFNAQKRCVSIQGLCFQCSPVLIFLKEKNKQVREWLGQHPDNVIVVHCKVRLIMTKMYWSSFDLDHYKRKRHWSSLRSKRGILIPS